MTVTKIEPGNFSHIFFPEYKELYNIEPYQSVGRFQDVKSITSVEVKSWKQYDVMIGADIHYYTKKDLDESDHDKWFIVKGADKLKEAESVYLCAK